MSARRVRPPQVDGSTWSYVVGRAGYRCQCRGECGRTHKGSASRCPVEAPAGELHAVSVDPAASAYKVCATPTDELIARCLSCQDRAVREARWAAGVGAAEQVDGQLPLVALEDLERAPGRRVA